MIGLAFAVGVFAPSHAARAAPSYITGFEMGSAGEAAIGVGLVIQGTTVRTGNYAMQANPAATQSIAEFRSRANGGTFRSLFRSARFYVQVGALPDSNVIIWSLWDSGFSSSFEAIQLGTNGKLSIGWLNAGTFSGTISSSALSADGHWHRIEVEVISSTSRKLFVDGSLWATDSTSITSGGVAQAGAIVGAHKPGTFSVTTNLYFDDIVFDDGDAIIGAGKDILLGPISDNAVTGWTAGAGGTTNLWNAASSIPPVGLAAASETNTSQIKDPATSATDNYDANMQTYTAGGVGAGDTVNSVMAIANTGEEITTGTKAGDIRVISNPSDGGADGSRYDFGDDGATAAGTFPTGWTTAIGVVVSSPTVTLGSSPVVRVGKRTSTNRVTDVDFVGVYVDYTPATQLGTATSSLQVGSRSDILSNSQPSATSNHTVAFTLNNSLVTQSSSVTNTLTLTFPSGFSLANVTCGDVDVATATQFLLNVSGDGAQTNCPNTATSWGMLIDSTNRIITLTTPSSTNQYVYVATGTQMTIKIGSNATSQNQGAHWITNPSTGGTYTVSVGGSFGGSGNVLISINSGVTVAATVAESLAFTASSVNAANCTADDGATVNTVTSTATSVPFGTISPNTFYQGCQDLIVSTNAGNGYSLTVQESHAMMTADGRFTIPDTTCDAGDCSVATATTWVTPTKNGFGHTCFNQSGSDCNATYGNGKKFKPLPNVPAGSAPSNISYVQSANVTIGSGTSESKAFTSNNTAGNLIVVSSGWNDNTVTARISDTAGNTYATSVGPIANNSSSLVIAQIWYAKNINAGANTVTITYSGSVHADMEIHEYSGIDTAIPFDIATSATGNSSTVSPASNFANTSFTNELIFGYGYTDSNTLSAGTGFTNREFINGDLSEDKMVFNAGSYNTTFGISGGSSKWVALMAAFRGIGTPVAIMSNTGTVTNSTGRVKYRLSAGAAQPAGTYTTVITYTIYAAY